MKRKIITSKERKTFRVFRDSFVALNLYCSLPSSWTSTRCAVEWKRLLSLPSRHWTLLILLYRLPMHDEEERKEMTPYTSIHKYERQGTRIRERDVSRQLSRMCVDWRYDYISLNLWQKHRASVRTFPSSAFTKLKIRCGQIQDKYRTNTVTESTQLSPSSHPHPLSRCKVWRGRVALHHLQTLSRVTYSSRSGTSDDSFLTQMTGWREREEEGDGRAVLLDGENLHVHS